MACATRVSPVRKEIIYPLSCVSRHLNIIDSIDQFMVRCTYLIDVEETSESVHPYAAPAAAPRYVHVIPSRIA